MDLTPRPNGPLNTPGHIRMDHHISAPVGSGGHRHFQFRLHELSAIQVIVQRGHATTGQQFDLRSPEQQLLAGAPEHLSITVGDLGGADLLGKTQ